MSFITSFKDIDVTKGFGDDTFKVLKSTDPLGFMYEQKRMKSQQDALVDPKQYIKNRDTAIETAMNNIYAHWGKKMKTYLETDGIPEPMARRKADAEAQAMWASALVEIDEDYPLSALGTAVQGQRQQNNLTFASERMPLKLSKKPAKRAPRKPRK